MRILVTGAAGFIGSHVVAHSLQSGAEVVAVIHQTARPELAASSAKVVACSDCADRAAVEKLFQGAAIDAVIHCAGRASDTGWPSAFRRANLEAAAVVAEVALCHGVKRVVHVSTTDVYGMRDFHGEDESLPFDLSARNPYPRFKIKAEQWLNANIPPDKRVIIRPAAVWGENDPTLTRRFLDFLRRSPFIVHFGKWRGQNRWPLADVRRVAAACFLGATHPDTAGRACNVIDPAHTTLDAFYTRLCDRHFPDRVFKRLFLSYSLGACVGACSSALSSLFNASHPLFDPSLYALDSISHNLDFNGDAMNRLLGQTRV